MKKNENYSSYATWRFQKLGFKRNAFQVSAYCRKIMFRKSIYLIISSFAKPASVFLCHCWRFKESFKSIKEIWFFEKPTLTLPVSLSASYMKFFFKGIRNFESSLFTKRWPDFWNKSGVQMIEAACDKLSFEENWIFFFEKNKICCCFVQNAVKPNMCFFFEDEKFLSTESVNIFSLFSLRPQLYVRLL